MLDMFDSGLNRILIPFDCIFDEDIGLFRVIRDFYANDSVFDMDLLNSDMKTLRQALKNYNNPLELVMKDEYKYKADDFYKEFHIKESDKIAFSSTPIKQITDFVNKINITGMGYITFLTTNYAQEVKIMESGGTNNIIRADYEEVNTENFDIIFVKRLSDAYFLKNLEGKYIYTFDYIYNVYRDEINPTLQFVLEEYCVTLGENNSIKILSLIDEE